MQQSGQIMFNRTPLFEETVHEEAHKEAVKEVAKHEEESKHKLQDLVRQTETPLMEIKSFSIFPVTVRVQKDRVIVKFDELFGSGQMRSLSIKDLGEAIVETGPLFATLRIFKRRAGPDPPTVVHWLWRSEAIRAGKYVQALIIADLKGVDTTTIEVEELIESLEEVGMVKEEVSHTKLI